MDNLSATQQDAIGEVFNLAIGQAAVSLSSMLSEEIELSVPEVNLVSRASAVDHISEKHEKDSCAIKQEFEGSLSGETFLVFPALQSLELVRSIFNEFDELEGMTELEQEALGEVGNVVLNACLSTLANHLELQFDVSLPQVYSGQTDRVLMGEDIHNNSENVTLLVNVQFNVAQRQIEGQVLIILDIDSVKDFVKAIDKLLASFGM